MAKCSICGKERGKNAVRSEDGKPDLVWCCLNCGKIVCRGCIENYEELNMERKCSCGYVITGNQRIDNNVGKEW